MENREKNEKKFKIKEIEHYKEEYDEAIGDMYANGIIFQVFNALYLSLDFKDVLFVKIFAETIWGILFLDTFIKITKELRKCLTISKKIEELNNQIEKLNNLEKTKFSENIDLSKFEQNVNDTNELYSSMNERNKVIRR